MEASNARLGGGAVPNARYVVPGPSRPRRRVRRHIGLVNHCYSLGFAALWPRSAGLQARRCARRWWQQLAQQCPGGLRQNQHGRVRSPRPTTVRPEQVLSLMRADTSLKSEDGIQPSQKRVLHWAPRWRQSSLTADGATADRRQGVSLRALACSGSNRRGNVSTSSAQWHIMSAMVLVVA